jgi:hypothetical protein
MEFISLLIGIILVILGFLFRVGVLNIIVKRFEWFQKNVIRRRDLIADEKAVSTFYSILCIVGASILLIGTGLQFIIPDNSTLISLWTWIICAVFGIIGILYLNINKCFIKEVSDVNL